MNTERPTDNRERTSRIGLLVGALAAILASSCCLGPLVLLTLGITGTWMSNLTALEPYRPFFIGVASVALVFAWLRIRRSAEACSPGKACAISPATRLYKVLLFLVAGLIAVALVSPLIAPSFY